MLAADLRAVRERVMRERMGRDARSKVRVILQTERYRHDFKKLILECDLHLATINHYAETTQESATDICAHFDGIGAQTVAENMD